ncbi:hypothetical protein EAG_12990 [Camponotus floridanus]|uniref:Uncharacterized protein n=1 Tax=Camponotus floridanus TaxID=104421 RepID=E2A9X6_CAMFO|nr:hypothetical protein EAG_12990 [Camponotus floridanus]
MTLNERGLSLASGLRSTSAIAAKPAVKRGHPHDGEDVAEYTKDSFYPTAALIIGRE